MFFILFLLALVGVVLFIVGVTEHKEQVGTLGLALVLICAILALILPKEAQAQTATCTGDSWIGNVCQSGGVNQSKEPSISSHQVSYNTGEYSVIAQPGSCNDKTCWYTIIVYAKSGIITAMFENNYTLIEAISPGCWKLQQTDEFIGLAGLPNDAGPFMPLVICKREGLYYDGTDKELAPFLKERLDKILCATRDCRDARTCVNDVKMKALIVELHIIQMILWKAGWKIALPEGWHGGLNQGEINRLTHDVERIINIRFQGHLPSTSR